MSLPITMEKSALLEALRENRDKHRAVFDAACEGYRKQATDWLEDNLAKVRLGKRPRLYFIQSPPEDHTRDYDRVISMYTAHTEPTLKVDEQTYAQYVLDDWGWKRQFIDTSNSYAAATVAEVYGEDEAE